MKRTLRNVLRKFKSLITPKNELQKMERTIGKFGPRQIISGPFKGMLYTNTSYGSAYYPKIFGTYEKEISHFFNVEFLNKFKSIIDIGCAEGYYFSGIAYLHSQESSSTFSSLIGYDINQDALNEAKRLLDLNKIKDYELKTSGYEVDLNNIKTPALLICDIEGGERDIIDIKRINALSDIHILVEIHDEPNNSDTLNLLLARFSDTHEITQYQFKERIVEDFPKINWLKISGNLKITLMAEGRIYGKNWLFMVPKVQYHN